MAADGAIPRQQDLGPVLSQPSISPLEHHLLGLLADGQAFGYQLLKLIEAAPHAHEVAGSGSVAVYQALGALQRRGWIDSHKEAGHAGKGHTAYVITQTGQSALWLATDQALREPATSEAFRRGVAYAQVLSPGILESRLAECALQLGEVRDRLRVLDEGAPPHRRSVVQLEGEVVDRTLEWLSELTAILVAPQAKAAEDPG